jgi:RND family efflux transporter MFP subunit
MNIGVRTAPWKVWGRFWASLPVLGLIASFFSCSKNEPAANSFAAPEVIVAKPLVKAIVEWDEYVGRLEPISTVEIRPRVGGYIESSPFVEGQVIEKGQLLFLIDPRPYESALRRAEATLKSADAELLSANASVNATKARQREVDARVQLAEDRYARGQQLRRTNAISDEEFETRESERQQALAEKNSADAQLESALAMVASANAAVDTAKAQLRTANIDLGYTKIKSPIAGRVGRRLVTPGNLVSGGTAVSTLLTTVVSLDPIHCYFEADEGAFLKYTRLANSGQRPSSRESKNPAYLALADEQGFPHRGHMDFVDNRLSSNTATIGGRAIFKNEKNDLAPGLFARVRIPGSATQEAILVPDEAISTDQSSRIVLVIGSDGSVQPRPVELGPIIDGLRVIRQGLKADDQLIIAGLQRAFPGTKPQLKESTIEPRFDDGLPDTYQPLPPEEWISTKEIINTNLTSGGDEEESK